MKRRWLTLLAACTALASAQSATTPIPVTQYATQEQQSNSAALTIQNGQVAPAPDLHDLLSLCNAPTAVLFDSDRSGRVDALRVYGVSRISASVWRLRGPNAVGSAAAKAELAAEEYAVKYLQGAAISGLTQDTSSESTTEIGAESSSGGATVSSASALAEVRSTLVQIRQRSVQGFLRNGRTTGTRTVSLGDGNMCVVIRYELPLDQRAGAVPGGSALPLPNGVSTSSTPQGAPGYVPLPPGSRGDF